MSDQELHPLQRRIEWVRTGPRAELVTMLAVLAALGLSTVHWLGLVAGGALVGLTAASTRRALVLGLYVGVFVVVGFLGWLWLGGALGKAIATGPLLGLSLAAGLGLPILGAGVRGLG